MDNKHIEELAEYIMNQFGCETYNDIPIIFGDEAQDRLAEKVKQYIDEENKRWGDI